MKQLRFQCKKHHPYSSAYDRHHPGLQSFLGVLPHGKSLLHFQFPRSYPEANEEQGSLCQAHAKCHAYVGLSNLQ